MALSFASAMVGPNGNMASSNNVQSCKRMSSGAYLLTYTAGFTASSGPQATPLGIGLLTGVNIGAQNACEVLVTGTDGRPQDGPFSFLVMGNS